MKGFIKAGLSAAAVAINALAVTGASAADLGDGWRGGSMKDGYAPVTRTAAGRCYLRGDVGYSFTDTMDIGFYSETTGRDEVRWVDSDSTWVGDLGIGCGSGSRGLRGDITFGYRGKFHTQGEPQLWFPDGSTPAEDDPIHVNITSYTAMVNAYYDFGNFRGFSPYLGAGIGLSHNKMDDVYFTENPLLVNTIEGGSKTSFAWAVMAGFGYQISQRAILDVGYRFMDLGDVSSGTIDSAGYVNPPVEVDDLTAHEFRVGLRYHFGGRRSHVVGGPLK